MSLYLSATPWLHAGEFINLGFESPNLPIQGSPAAALFPGWSLQLGDGTPPLHVSLGAGSIPISAPQAILNGTGPNGIAQDLYGAWLISGLVEETPVLRYEGISISQTGRIPDGTKMLVLRADVLQPSIFSVTLNDFPISMSLSATHLGVFLGTYEGDISNYSGQTMDLKIEVAKRSSLFVTDISFAPQGIPEPSAYALLAFGLAGFGWRARRVRKP